MLKIGFLADRYINPDEVRSWSGVPYYFALRLRAAGCEVVTVRAEREPSVLPGKMRQAFWKYTRGQRYLRDLDPALMRSLARGWENRLRKLDVDLVFSASSWPLAELNTHLPTVFWTDATFGAMKGFYGSFSNLAPVSTARGMAVEGAALRRCTMAVYASDWAARSAVRDHGADPAKVRVLSLGANLETLPPREKIQAGIPLKAQAGECQLLLIGVDWERKGARLAVEAFRELRRLGVPVRLRIVGCYPPKGFELPDGVEIVGFLDKNTHEGQQKLANLYQEAHFFILPSRAEAYGVVFCEAAAFGLPCLAAAVGGVSSIIHDGENGQLLPLEAKPEDYARWIAGVWNHPDRYVALAHGALAAYYDRLDATRSAELLVDDMTRLVRCRTSARPEGTLIS